MHIDSLPTGAYVVAGFVDIRHNDRNVRLGTLASNGDVALTDEGRLLVAELSAPEAPAVPEPPAAVPEPPAAPRKTAARKTAKAAPVADAADEAPSLADALASLGA